MEYSLSLEDKDSKTLDSFVGNLSITDSQEKEFKAWAKTLILYLFKEYSYTLNDVLDSTSVDLKQLFSSWQNKSDAVSFADDIMFDENFTRRNRGAILFFGKKKLT